MSFIWVGAGGAVGAVLRYGISLIPCKSAFPILTLITNLLGALAIGFIVGLGEKKGLGDNAMLFLKTGLCGGFTTFSTFSLEAYNLMKSGDSGMAVVYALLSVTLCVLGVFLGMAAAKKI